jgi:hypothetical protein
MYGAELLVRCSDQYGLSDGGADISTRHPQRRQCENMPRGRASLEHTGCPCHQAISCRMTDNDDKRPSQEEPVGRREYVKRGIKTPPRRRRALIPKPKERPASKGRVHKGRMRR